MEALGDAVVPGKAPHAGDFLGPFGEGFAERTSGLEAARTQGVNEAEELPGVVSALGCGLSFQAQQREEPLLEFVDALESGMEYEEFFQVLALIGVQAMSSAAQEAKPGPVPAEIGTQLPGYAHEVHSDHAHRVEAVCHDPGPGKPAFDQKPVSVGQIDANHSYPLPAAQACQVSGQLRLAATRTDIEDPMLFQIAERRREALALVQRMLVDSQNGGAVQAQSLLCLPLGKLSVDAAHGSLPEAFPKRQPGGADPIVVPTEHLFSPTLRAVPPRHDSG